MLCNHLVAISESRLSPYKPLANKFLGFMGGNDEISAMSICIYTALQHRLGIFFSLLQEIEVSYRNAICRILRDYAENDLHISLEKFFCMQAVGDDSKLSEVSSRVMREALVGLSDITTKKRINNIDLILHLLEINRKSANDIIASLPFGFWVHLLNHREQYNQHFRYWNHIFSRHGLFGNRFRGNKDVFDNMEPILKFRNKLFHQEPVWKGKNVHDPLKALIVLRNKYDSFSNILGKISPERLKIRGDSSCINQQYMANFHENDFKGELIHLYTNHMGKNHIVV